MSPKSSSTIKLVVWCVCEGRVDVGKRHISHSENCLQSLKDNCNALTMTPWVTMFSDLDIRKSVSMYLMG